MYGGPEDAMKKAKNQASSNNSNGAIETLEAYLVNDPHNVEVRMLLANIAFNAMMHNYAIMQLNIIVDLDPDNEDARRALLTIYKNDKKTVRQANEQFQYLLEKHPEDPDLLNSYGIFCRLQLLDNKKSEEYYLKAIELDPNRAEFHLNYAILLVNDLKKYTEARAHLERALELDPNNTKAKEALDKLLRKKFPKDVKKKGFFSFLRKR